MQKALLNLDELEFNLLKGVYIGDYSKRTRIGVTTMETRSLVAEINHHATDVLSM